MARTQPPAGPGTLGDALRAPSSGDGVMVFHLDKGRRRVSVDELQATALARAGQLADLGIRPGERVGLLGPNRPEWVGWAHGVWQAGATLVPLPAPVRVRDPAAYRDQLGSLVAATGSRIVITHPRFLSWVSNAVVLNWDHPSSRPDAVPAHVEASDTAVVLCTSGSTAKPKGIRVTHATMLARNAAPFLGNRERQPGTRWLGWVPFFHAFGLMLLLQPLRDGTECHVLPVERFARDPATWLRLLGPTEATVTSAPSSAWAAALRLIARDPSGVDFSNLKRAYFGMEMVDADVLDRLLEVGTPLGLSPNAVAAGYGLSEGGGTTTAPGAGVRVDRIDLARLASSGRAVPATGARRVKRVVSVGMPGPDHEVRIAGPDGALPERHVGEVQFRGPGVMDGYLDPEEPDPIEDGWLHTGDLGYLADGDLFLTGRIKELIVHFGRNYHPEDIERAAARVDGVSPGGCVAFAPFDGAEGDVVIAVEAPPGGDLSELGSRVRAAVSNATGVVPRDVLVVAEGAIPRAANGKLQRAAAREALGRGELSTSGRSE